MWIIAAYGVEEHVQIVRKVFEGLVKNTLKLQMDKCKFM